MAESSILPFLLPKVDLDGWETCCEIVRDKTHLDHAKDFHDFSLSRLAWAIQHKADVECIERYLNHFDPLKVQAELLRMVKGRSVIEWFPILFFAVERNSPEIVRVLCKFGADPSRRALRAGLPLLAYTILCSEYSWSDTSDTLLVLLAKGANPDEVPSDMWETPLRTPRGDTPEKLGYENTNVRGWCTPEVRKALARNLTLAQRYSLWRAEHIAPPTARMVQVAEAFSILALLETPYHIIGQTPAIKQVIDAVASHYLFDSGFLLSFSSPVRAAMGKLSLLSAWASCFLLIFTLSTAQK